MISVHRPHFQQHAGFRTVVSHADKHGDATVKRLSAQPAADQSAEEDAARQKPPSFVRFLPDFQYLFEPFSGVWLLGCGVLTSREA